MNFEIFHIETDEEIIIKFTIWVQTFSLYPIKKETKENDLENVKFYKKQLNTALNNLK